MDFKMMPRRLMKMRTIGQLEYKVDEDESDEVAEVQS